MYIFCLEPSKGESAVFLALIHIFKIRSAKTEVFCCLRLSHCGANILFRVQILVFTQIFTFRSVFSQKLWRYKALQVIRALTLKSKFGQKFAQALISWSNRHNLVLKTNMNMKIYVNTKLIRGSLKRR